MKDRELRDRYRIDDCTRCGNECASSCPVHRFYGAHHPQDLAKTFLERGADGVGDHRLLWGCVTCGACTEACPFDVEFAAFVRELRIGRSGYRPVREGLVHAIQRAQAEMTGREGRVGRRARGGGRGGRPGAGSRLDWLDSSLETNGSDGFVLFIGCLPYLQRIFDERGCGYRPLETARAAVRVLNRLGISPVLLEDERCCGRDLFDIGERETFRLLAEHNAAVLAGAGAETVLTVCPECAYTIGITYPEWIGPAPYEVRHITEYIAERLDGLHPERAGTKLAFHDPCYLGRYRGILEEPRRILEAISVEKPVEMARSGRSAPCCGAGSWIDHGPHTRHAVNERLVEAGNAGADLLVTACPKCALLMDEVGPGCSWRRSPVEVVDLLCLLDSRLKE